MSARSIATTHDQAALRLYRRAAELQAAAGELLAASRELLLHLAAASHQVPAEITPPLPRPAAAAAAKPREAAPPTSAAAKLRVAVATTTTVEPKRDVRRGQASPRTVRDRDAVPRRVFDLAAANDELRGLPRS